VGRAYAWHEELALRNDAATKMQAMHGGSVAVVEPCGAEGAFLQQEVRQHWELQAAAAIAKAAATTGLPLRQPCHAGC
jgi:hypothetical protein